MTLIYRKAGIGDVPELTDMRCRFLKELSDIKIETAYRRLKQTNEEYFAAALAEGRFAAWLCVYDGKTVGTSGVAFSAIPPSMKCPNGKLGYIMNMYTLPEYRGRGIASELFQRIVAEARTWGCTKITLNATAMGFPIYQEFGFSAVSSEMEYCVLEDGE